MAYFTRATSNVPGATGYHFYGDSAWEHLFIHRGANIRKRMPCIVYVKPGHSFNPGERVMDADTSSTPALGIAAIYFNQVRNWPVVGLEISPVFSASSAKRESFQSRPFPGELLSVMRAIRYLRENSENEALWGVGGSLDTSKILFMGSSSGATNGMLASFVPPGAVEHYSPAALGAPFDSAIDHRPNVMAGWIGQVDWTQFVLSSTGGGISGPFRFDTMQYFSGQNSSLTNTALANSVKRAASPWFWVPYASQRIPVFGSWGKRPTSGNGMNLKPADFLPNTPRNDVAGKKAFQDPHHYFQAQPLERALKSRGVPNRILWGDVAENPQGFNDTAVLALGMNDPLFSTLQYIRDPMTPDTNDRAAEAAVFVRWMLSDLGWV